MRERRGRRWRGVKKGSRGKDSWECFSFSTKEEPFSKKLLLVGGVLLAWCTGSISRRKRLSAGSYALKGKR